MNADANDAVPPADAAPDDGADDAPEPSELPEDALLVLPVRRTVLFPGLVQPITLDRPRSIAAAQEAVRSGRPLGVLLQSDAEADEPTPGQMHEVGTVCEVLRYLTTPTASTTQCAAARSASARSTGCPSRRTWRRGWRASPSPSSTPRRSRHG